jgi:Protein of unknown function (DUF2786)
MDMQKIIERVQKMLNLGRDKGASEGERDNAMRMVQAYLAKYNLDLETVEGTMSKKDHKKQEDQGGPRTHHVHTFFGRPWACNAAISVADLCFCGYLYRSARMSKDCQHLFIGRTANAITAAYLAEYVVRSIYREGKKRQRDETRDNPWFLSFAWGAALSVQIRVKQLKDRKDIINGSTGKELVLASYYESEREANRDYTKVAFPHLKRATRGKGIRDKDGYDQGQAFGETINLNRQVGGNR